MKICREKKSNAPMVDGPRLEIIYFEMSSAQRLTTLTAPLNKRHRCNIDKLVAKPNKHLPYRPKCCWDGKLANAPHSLETKFNQTHTHWATEFVFKQDFFLLPCIITRGPAVQRERRDHTQCECGIARSRVA